MTMQPSPNTQDDFTPPGIIKLSPAVVEYARAFLVALQGEHRGDFVATLDWATSVSVKRGPNEPSEDVAPCVMLGALERHEIPSGFTQTIDGVEFAIQIPQEIWSKSTERLIDMDNNLLFKLALR